MQKVHDIYLSLFKTVRSMKGKERWLVVTQEAAVFLSAVLLTVQQRAAAYKKNELMQGNMVLVRTDAKELQTSETLNSKNKKSGRTPVATCTAIEGEYNQRKKSVCHISSHTNE